MANPLDYLKDLIPEDTNIFGASPDANLKKMLDMGLLGNQSYQDMIDKADKQSIFQGLLNTGLAYAAQPKTGNYGTIVPYLAKAGLAGMKAAQTPYDNLTKDAMEFYQLEKMQEEKDKKNNIQNLLSTYGKPNAFKESSKTYNNEQPINDFSQAVDSSLMGVNQLGMPNAAPNLRAGNAQIEQGGAYFDESKFLKDAVANEALGLGDFLTLKASTGKTKDFKYLTKEEAQLRGLPEIPDTKAYQVESTTGETKVIDLGYRTVGTTDFETVSKELGYPVRLEMQTQSQTKEVNELITKRENDAAALSGGIDNYNEIGTAGQNAIDKAISATTSNRYNYNQLTKTYDPEFLTYEGRLKAWTYSKADKLNQLTDPKKIDYLSRYSSFTTRAARQLNSYIKEITGAQMGEKEADRIRRGIPDPDNDSPIVYERKLRDMRRDLAYSEARLMWLKANGAVSLEMVGSKSTYKIDENGNEVIDQLGDGVLVAKDANGREIEVPTLGKDGSFAGLIRKRGNELAAQLLKKIPKKDGQTAKLEDYPTLLATWRRQIANEFGLPSGGL